MAIYLGDGEYLPAGVTNRETYLNMLGLPPGTEMPWDTVWQQLPSGGGISETVNAVQHQIPVSEGDRPEYEDNANVVKIGEREYFKDADSWAQSGLNVPQDAYKTVDGVRYVDKQKVMSANPQIGASTWGNIIKYVLPVVGLGAGMALAGAGAAAGSGGLWGGAIEGASALGAGTAGAGTLAGAGAVDWGSGAALESLIGGGAGTGTAAFGSVAPAASGLGTGAGAQTLAGLGSLPATTWGAGGLAGLGLTAEQVALATGAGSSFMPSGSGETFGISNDILKGVLQAGGGLLAADATGDAQSDVANQYLALGAPSRARFEGSFAPGFDLMKAEPGLQGAMDTAANTSARALSTRFGNPADSPTAQAEMNKYLAGNLYLPQLNTYRSQNLTGGGQGVNIAGTGSLGAANTVGQGWEALGAGAQTALGGNPMDEWMKRMMAGNTGFGGSGSNPYSLSVGGMPFGGNQKWPS